MADERPFSEDLSPDASASEYGTVTITVVYRKACYQHDFHEDATVKDLFEDIEALYDIPVANQKILVPKGPMLKAPFKEPITRLADLEGKRLTLLGCGAAEIEAVQKMSEKVAKRNASRMAHRGKAKPSSRRSQSRTAEDSKYTFLQVRPLQGLPHPERSQLLLMRLKQDRGIKTAMRKHKFTVSLLTEMEPLAHTQSSHEGTSRTLGLNRNQGEVIELRLRTDAHDGYRDYKTIRKTLCHELAHNVHGPHDRQFWDLCHQIEREVLAADWKSGGQTIAETSRYTITGEDEEEDHEDAGGWSGGEFVLGGVRDTTTANLSRREILAQAALERQHREDEAEQKAVKAACKGWRPCQRSKPSDETK